MTLTKADIADAVFQETDLGKAQACQVVDAANVIRVFLLPMDHLLRICPVKERGAYWKVSNKYLDQYMNDPEIKIFELRTSTKSWWKGLAT